MSRLRRIALAVSVAALAVAAAAVPAAANADLQPDPGAPQAPAQGDSALRPTAIEYGLIAGLLSQQPGTEPAVGPGVLDPDDDPAFDPGFGGGSLGPGAITPSAASAGEDGPIETEPASGG
jgi:hypothetical protein